MAEWAPVPGGNRIVPFSPYWSGDGVINSSASANVKGAYEAVYTTVYDFDGLLVNFSPATLAVRDYLCDISIGAGGSETIILPNLLYSASTVYEYAPYYFPIHVPGGSVIRARTQCSTGSSGHEIFFFGFGSSFDGLSGCSRVEALGVNTADSGATSVDPGGTTGVLGAWTQIAASTSFDYRYLIIAFGNQANGARTSMVGDVTIGVGAAAAEVNLIETVRFGAHSTTDNLLPHVYPPFPVSIPAGTRISARAVNYSTNASPARLIDVALYGIG